LRKVINVNKLKSKERTEQSDTSSRVDLHALRPSIHTDNLHSPTPLSHRKVIPVKQDMTILGTRAELKRWLKPLGEFDSNNILSILTVVSLAKWQENSLKKWSLKGRSIGASPRKVKVKKAVPLTKSQAGGSNSRVNLMSAKRIRVKKEQI